MSFGPDLKKYEVVREKLNIYKLQSNDMQKLL